MASATQGEGGELALQKALHPLHYTLHCTAGFTHASQVLDLASRIDGHPAISVCCALYDMVQSEMPYI